MVIAMVIYPNVRHQSEGIKIVVETKMLYYRKIKSCCYGNHIRIYSVAKDTYIFEKMTVHCCCRGYLATETNILLLKIQNTNEYGIKIKYHRRYLIDFLVQNHDKN
jgi:hypothetical protein